MSAKSVISVSILSVVISLILVVVHSAPDHPPAWPNYFTANYSVYYQPYGPYWKSEAGGHVYYNHLLKAMHSTYDEWCAPMFENPIAYNFSCGFLFVNDTAYYLNNGDPTQAPCCVFMKPFAPPKPDFFDDAKYAGTTIMHAQNTTIWHKEGFGYLSYEIYNGTKKDIFGIDVPTYLYAPASLWGPLAEGYLQIDYTAYDASVPPNPSVFDLPPQCVAATDCNESYLGKSATSRVIRPFLPLSGQAFKF